MRTVDITEKLNFDENPALVVKGEKLEINADAATVLKIMGVLGDETGPKQIVEMYELLFGEKTRKKIDKLKLSFKDLQVLVEEALNLVTGEDDEQGETQIPATT